MKTKWIISGLLVLMLAGCGARAFVDPAGLPEPAPTVAAVGGADQAAVQARAWLAGQLGVSQDSIQLVSAKAVTWPNPALGCPVLGVMYANVETPGYLYQFDSGGASHEVHADQSGTFVDCHPGQPRLPGQ
jgi:hypothetical protein